MNDEDEPTAPRIPLQTATLNLAARQQREEDPSEISIKERNEDKAKARGLGRLFFGGTRYWYDKKTDILYELASDTEAIGKKVGKFLRMGKTGKIVSDEEYAAAKK
jgi:hypothetical protein